MGVEIETITPGDGKEKTVNMIKLVKRILLNSKY